MSNKDTPAAAEPSVMAKAESVATVRADIDLQSTMLIGFVGKTEALDALLRKRDGSVIRVSRGDKTPVGTVIGIDGETLRVQNGGTVKVMRLPRS